MLALLATLTTGCTGGEDLRQLQDLAIADFQLAAAERTSHREVSDHAGGPLRGKPRYARITQSYVPVAGSTLDEVLADAVRSVRAAGFALEPGNIDDYWVQRRDDLGPPQVSVSVYIAQSTQPPMVIINIRAP